jgi:hypothetical protein
MDAVTQDYAVLGHRSFLWLIKPHVPMLLIDAGLNRTPGLATVDLLIFARDAIEARCFQVKVVLDGPEKLATGGLQF